MHQAIDALLALNEAAEAARVVGLALIDAETHEKHEDWYRQAAATGIVLNAAHHGKLQQERNAIAARMKDRKDDYLRFARDLRVPLTNNVVEKAICMSKLRIKISGRMRSIAGAEEFCAICSYLATTAARQGIGALEAFTRAFQGNAWTPEPEQASRHQSTNHLSRNREGLSNPNSSSSQEW